MEIIFTNHITSSILHSTHSVYYMLIQFCHLITVYHFKQLLTIFICTYFISTYAANLRIVVYYIYLR